MSMVRAATRQIVMSTVVLSGVFAAGYFAGTSASLEKMQTDCLMRQGTWSDGLCNLTEVSR